MGSEGYGVVFLALAVLAVAMGFMCAFLTRLRGLPAASVAVLPVFLISLLWLEDFYIAVLAALVAAFPVLAGVGLRAMVSRRRA